MSESVEVHSLTALAEWHAALANYAEILADGLAGVELELRRVADWLNEQAAYWKRMVRQREEEVTRAKAELSQRQFPGWDGRIPDCTVQRKNLQRAKARLEHAQNQVERVRRWQTRLPKIIEEVYRGAAHRLQRMLESTIPAALEDLQARLAALEAYTAIQPTTGADPGVGTTYSTTASDTTVNPTPPVVSAPTPAPAPPLLPETGEVS
jgi:DNA repair exonuclease SbcCD ATPase subunit